jgi:Protein of unknown function (DUF2630)
MAGDGDSRVQNHIEALVAEEHKLLSEREREGAHSPERHERLEAVRVELDRYWDLLRQRRAHEEFGLDPENTSIRNEGTVESYEG